MSVAIYSPFFKSKRGEAKALAHLSLATKAEVLPFFDVLALPQGTVEPSEVQAHLVKQVGNISTAWRRSGPCYVDLYDVNPMARALEGRHPLGVVAAHLHGLGIPFIPVVGLARDVHYRLALRGVLQEGPLAIAVRLEAEDMRLPRGLARRIHETLAEIGATNIDLHVIADFRSIAEGAGGSASDMFLDALSEIQQLRPARVVFAASNMVSSMGAFKANSLNRVARNDLLAWREVVTSAGAGIAFGDYGVVHPDYVDLDPRLIRPAAKIRYATPSEWIIIKGTCWRDDTSQHHHLAQMLARTSDFRGGDCWGGEYIVSAAAGRPTYGSLETWVTVDQNAHVETTVTQTARIAAAVV
jgi:hypothetical protein